MKYFKHKLILVQFIFALSINTALAEELSDYVYWKDQQIAQLEELTWKLVDSVQSLGSKIRSVAISNISYGDTLPSSFRKVATARLQQTLTSQIKLKVSVSEACSQIRTDISGSFLKISRGIADDKFRREIAKDLNVNGFLDIALFTSKGQLSISLNAYEAKDGDVFSNKSLSLISEITEVLDNDEQISDEAWLEQYGLTLEVAETLKHIKRVQSLTNIRIQKNEDDVLSAPLLVPKTIPKDINILGEIKSEAGKQSSLPLFMFSKDHRFGAISISTDFGTIPLIENQNEDQSLFSDDDWNDDFEDSVDDQAVLQKVKFKDNLFA